MLGFKETEAIIRPNIDQNLVRILRSVSLDEGQGIIEAKLGNNKFRILVYQGKIIEASWTNRSSAVAVCERLFAAGKLLLSVRQQFADVDVSMAELYRLLVQQQEVSHDDFIKAKCSYEFDVLHRLRWVSGENIDFKPSLVSFDSKFSIALSPGQLLLDLFELEHDENRFQDALHGLTFNVAAIEKTNVEPKLMTDIEKSVWDVIENGSLVEQVFERCLLSQHHVRSALLSLLDFGVIELKKSETLIQVQPAFDSPKVDSFNSSENTLVEDDIVIFDEEELILAPEDFTPVKPSSRTKEEKIELQDTDEDAAKFFEEVNRVLSTPKGVKPQIDSDAQILQETKKDEELANVVAHAVDLARGAHSEVEKLKARIDEDPCQLEDSPLIEESLIGKDNEEVSVVSNDVDLSHVNEEDVEVLDVLNDSYDDIYNDENVKKEFVNLNNIQQAPRMNLRHPIEVVGDLNNFMLSEQIVPKLLATIVLLFLVVLSLYLPSTLTDWLAILSKFSSNQ